MPTFSDTTLLMVAKNASDTIARALRSALDAGAGPILLVDSSEDGATLEAAKTVLPSGHPFDLVQLDPSTTIGVARQTALEAARTPYGFWLDADDAISDHHISAYRAGLEDGYDYVVGGAMVVAPPDYSNGAAATIPDALQQPQMAYWCFERNWFPSLHAAVRIDWAKDIGFDVALRGAEDHSFLLKALAAEMRYKALEQTSYQYTVTPGSVSRDMVGRAADARRTAQYWLDNAGLSSLINTHLGPGPSCWIKASLASLIGDWSHFDEAVSSFAGLPASEDVMHPFYGKTLAVLFRFLENTKNLRRGFNNDADWAGLLSQSQNPAFLNNAGVSAARGGHETLANTLFDQALGQLAHYKDAAANKECLENGYTGDLLITKLPMRIAVARMCS